jgi:SAM-dependent methyltransferase
MTVVRDDSYGRIARRYAEAYGGELVHKPLDRALLELVVAERAAGSVIADVGCGPGHVTQYLRDLGASVIGVDLSPGMIALARELAPDLDFRAGSLLDLGVADAAWGAIVALYSIIHLPDGTLEAAMRECARALCAGGLLLVSFHVGDEVIHRDEMLGEPVSLDFHFLATDDVVRAMESVGMRVAARIERQPYTVTETPTTRGYILARKAQ